MGYYDGARLKYVGKIRNGFVSHMRCAMMPLLEELLTDKCSFDDLPLHKLNLQSGRQTVT